MIKRRETDRDSQKSGKETTHQAEKQTFISRKSPTELGLRQTLAWNQLTKLGKC